MATIPVPAPPKSAFNKNRPISDLLQHQLKHFRHVEAKLPNELHSNMTARDLHTENGAAQYIAHITEALKSLHQVSTPAAIPIPIRRRPAAAPAAPSTSPQLQQRRTVAPPQNIPLPLQPPSRKICHPAEAERSGGTCFSPPRLPAILAPKAPKQKPRSKEP